VEGKKRDPRPRKDVRILPKGGGKRITARAPDRSRTARTGERGDLQEMHQKRARGTLARGENIEIPGEKQSALLSIKARCRRSQEGEKAGKRKGNEKKGGKKQESKKKEEKREKECMVRGRKAFLAQR